MTNDPEEMMDWMDNEMVHYVSDEYMDAFRNTQSKYVAFTCPYTLESYFLFLSYRGFFR
jgi:hypothetical protein